MKITSKNGKLTDTHKGVLKKATARQKSMSGIHSSNSKKVHLTEMSLIEIAHSKEVDRKIEEFFTAPRNFDFSINTEKKRRWAKAVKNKTDKTWLGRVTGPYASLRSFALGERYRKHTIMTVTILFIAVLVWLIAILSR